MCSCARFLFDCLRPPLYLAVTVVSLQFSQEQKFVAKAFLKSLNLINLATKKFILVLNLAILARPLDSWLNLASSINWPIPTGPFLVAKLIILIT